MGNTSKTAIITLPPEAEGTRLDFALAKQLPEYSRMQIKQWIDQDNVLMDGKSVKASYKIRGSEEIAVTMVEKEQPEWLAEPIALPIFYEDEDLILINKPAGMVVHPGAGNQSKTLLNALLHHEPKLQALPRAGIVHRIDKDTTGLLIVAKNTLSLQSLNKQLKDKSLLREYRAIVMGKIISGSTLSAPIDRHPRERKKMAVVETGKAAVTHYRVLEKFRGHTLLKVQLETGRTHQIRVHMAYMRHPIVGDPIYGGRLQVLKNTQADLLATLRTFNRQALHAFGLEFIHPRTNEPMRFETTLPDDMQQLIQQLREDNAQ